MKKIIVNEQREMDQYKRTIMFALEKFYNNHPAINDVWEAILEDGFPENQLALFIWMASLLGNPNLKYGLEPGSLCSVGQKFFGSKDEVMYINGLEDRDALFLTALQSCIEIPDETGMTYTNLPFVLLVTDNGKPCVKCKSWFQWSQELTDQIATRRGLLPPSRVHKIRNAKDSVYGKEIPGVTSRCGKMFIDGDVAADVLNILNFMELAVNGDVLEEAVYLTKNIDPKTGLPMRLVDENGTPIETVEEWKKRCDNHKDFLASRKNIATTYVNGGILHCRWAVDGCGRCYSINGAEINPQGTDCQKAIIETYRKRDLIHQMKPSWIETQCKGMTRFNAEQYIILALASAFGYDKTDWHIHFEAISLLFSQYKGDLQQIFDDVKDNKLFKIFPDEEPFEVDSPATVMALLSALDDCWNNDKMTGVTLHLDATSSGSQLICIQHCDPNTAEQANLIVFEDKPKHRQNIYYSIKDGTARFAEKAGRPLPMKINKYKVIKNGASIPYQYGSNKGPKTVFGKSHVGFFISYMTAYHPSLAHNHGYMVEIWDPERTEYTWTLPDGFEVKVYAMDDVDYSMRFCDEYVITAHNKNIIQPLAKSRQLGANKTQSEDGFMMREVVRSAHPNIKKNSWIWKHIEECGTQKTCGNEMLMKLLKLGESSGFYSLRIINEIECEADIRVVPKFVMKELLGQYSTEVYDVIPIHDCFMVPPFAANHVRASYIYNLYKMARTSKWNPFIMKQILLKDNVPNKEFYPDRKEFAEEILKTADYALC